MTPVDLSYPFTGRWLTQNSPANRVPSHGTAAFATSYAIDFVPVADNGRTAPVTLGSLFRPEDPERFPGFGRAVTAPIDGRVVEVHDSSVDHPAYRGFPSVGYALTQGRRIAAGWLALAGNHVMIETPAGVIVALCHLRQHSVSLEVGDQVRVGDLCGECGNSGNSTEPHLHLQAIDSLDIRKARAVPITFNGSVPVNGDVVNVSHR